MDLKKKIGVLGFLVLGFIPKAIGQSYIVIDKDTFGTVKKYITPDHRITSKWDKMGKADCISSNGGFPWWRIENDSLFLTRIVVGFNSSSDEREEYNEILADLPKEFGKRYVNGRVFAKEISDRILAYQVDTFNTDTATFYTETIAFFTIKHGKLIKRIEFTGTTQWPLGWRDGYHSNKAVAQRKDWQTQPEMPLNGGTKVIVKIAVDDNGKATKTEIIEGGSKRWNKSIIKTIKFLNLCYQNHFGYRNYDDPKVIYKKDKVIFIVKKPR
jgi:hypothetical protein